MSQDDQQPQENIEETASEEPIEAEVVENTAEEITEEEAAELEKPHKVEIPKFRPGDTVRILYKIIEGDKTRIQPYEGIVIARKGKDIGQTFTVRRIGADNVGVERIFPLNSPNITKLEVKKTGKVRRAKLYYLRDKVGKAAIRVKEGKPVQG